MAVERSHNQEPALFEEVTMKLTEEKEFEFDPYLFALSGNDLQQYCTLLSWLEMRNHNSEMSLEMEEGMASPLSLVQVVEEFEVSPDLYKVAFSKASSQAEGDELPSQTKEKENFMPLIRLQYNFVQGTDLQTSSSKFIPTGANVSLLPKAAGESSRKKGLLSKILPQEKRSHPKNNVEGNINKIPFPVVPEESHAGQASCPHSAGTHYLNPIPVGRQQISPEAKTFHGPNSSHAFKCCTASPVEKKKTARAKQKKCFGPAQELKSLPSAPRSIGEQAAPIASQCPQKVAALKKPHQCPLCGNTFTVRSSVVRHLKQLHDGGWAFKYASSQESRLKRPKKQKQQEIPQASPLP